MGTVILRLFATLLMLTILNGCTSMQNPSPHDVGQWSGDESIVVIGMPDTHRVVIRNGVQHEKSWKAKSVVLDAIHKPEHQYIITRLQPQQDKRYYGIEIILKRWDSTSKFRVCKGIETLVFNVPVNKVMYIADLNVTTNDNTTHLNISNNIDDAKKHLQAYYPNIADQLVQADTAIMPLANISCNFGLTDFLDAFSAALLGASSAL